jgi:hypothetical protein
LASSNDGVQTKQPQPARAGAIGVPA